MIEDKEREREGQQMMGSHYQGTQRIDVCEVMQAKTRVMHLGVVQFEYLSI